MIVVKNEIRAQKMQTKYPTSSKTSQKLPKTPEFFQTALAARVSHRSYQTGRWTRRGCPCSRPQRGLAKVSPSPWTTAQKRQRTGEQLISQCDWP